MNRRRTAWCAAVVAAVAVLAGCGLPQDGEARAVDARSVPYGLLGPVATEAPTVTTLERAPSTQPRTYLLGPDEALEPVPAPVDLSQVVDTPKVLAALFELLAAGPTEAQRAKGLSTALAPGVQITVVAVHEGLVDVQVDASPKDPSADRLPLAIGQLVLTATSVEGVDGVRLLRAGVPVEVPLPGGALTSSPLRRSDYRELVVPATPTAPTTASP
jgi:spore germination protein GerM